MNFEVRHLCTNWYKLGFLPSFRPVHEFTPSLLPLRYLKLVALVVIPNAPLNGIRRGRLPPQLVRSNTSIGARHFVLRGCLTLLEFGHAYSLVEYSTLILQH